MKFSKLSKVIAKITIWAIIISDIESSNIVTSIFICIETFGF